MLVIVWARVSITYILWQQYYRKLEDILGGYSDILGGNKDILGGNKDILGG